MSNIVRYKGKVEKGFGAFIILLSASLLLTACSSTKPASKAKAVPTTPVSAHPTFVYLQTNGDELYFVLEAKGAKAEGRKLGVTVKVENENDSSATTISDIQTAIADHVNGLIVVAPSASLGPRMVALARAAHIPIMASDNGFAGPHGKAVPFVGIDATAFGESTGRGLVEWYKKLGWTPANTYELLYVVPSLPTCNLRTNAEKSVLESAGFPSSHIIDVPYDGTETKGFDNTGPVVTAHPGVVHWMLSGCNTDGPAGGAKYLTSHGVSPNNIIVSGLGGDLVCQLWAPGAPNLGIRTTNFISGYDIGADAVRDMYDYVVKHQPFPADTYVKPVRLTPKNYLKIDTACKAS